MVKRVPYEQVTDPYPKRHVVEMAAAGTSVLATVAVFTTMQGLVLVLIYITFLLGTFVDVICE